MKAETLDIFDGVYLEWKKFITNRNHDTCKVYSQIAESWCRSYDARVNPHNANVHRSLDNNQLNKLLKEKEKFIKVAKPFMANLYKFVKGSGFVIVLTDEYGYIMEMFSDEDTLKNPLTRNFFLGASWREDEVGTNAIGTSLIVKEPIQVSGAEHFCQKHHCLTCSAAPILDSNGRIIGVLDISGASYASHLHTLGMVVAAAEAIMAQLSILHKNHELALVNNRLTNFFNSVSDGVIIVDKRDVVIEINPAAKEIIGKSEQNILGIQVNRLFDRKRFSQEKNLATKDPYHDIEIMVDTQNGLCHCVASGEPITDEQGEITGGMIILRPIKQVQNLVNRFSSYYATLKLSDIIGESVEIQEAIRLASLTATTTSNVLLQGESGTGKEIFAQGIHNRSMQHAGPFIALNCGAIPRELIGSELFGYEEGAFTGAKRGGKPGKFELAAGGTLFLDEIGDMPLEQQTALLRVIQEKKVTRIGGDKMIPVNVRLMCATNKNLLQEVEKGAFRHDLFYRLNVMAITIPPLRNRIDDVPLLFKHFLEKLGCDWGCKFYTEPEVFDCLKQYHWPGNVRELQNVVERAASLAENGIITLRHLPVAFNTPSSYIPPLLKIQVPQSPHSPDNREQRQKLAKDAEKQEIISLLNQHGGNVSQVARVLGMSRKTLYNKMDLYSIQN